MSLWEWFMGDKKDAPIKKSNQSIVLDMDECLLHTWDVKQKEFFKEIELSPKTLGYRRYIFEVFAEPKNKQLPVYGIMRPGLIDFLTYCFDRFDNIILWSAGQDFYVEKVSDYIFHRTEQIPTQVLARSKCHILNKTMFTKPLYKLNEMFPEITLENCFFVDDNPDNSHFNKENHIVIPAFEPECTVDSISDYFKNDRALYDLVEWFEREDIKKCDDVRTLSKDDIFNIK
jgi:TFIIF-interacting CTD phosphatase-like protein